MPPFTDFTRPITLTGPQARLEPLSHDHLEGLIDATRDGELWKLWYTPVPAPERMAAEIDRRLGLRDAGSMHPFTVLDAGGRVAGMTTFMNIDAVNRRVEIGSTWTRAACQRSGLNTQSKLLLLTDAFERLGCIAVEFRTHRLNQQSRRAIERLGAQLDGILRSHLRMPDGTLRDTCVYSITATEWPTVKTHLQWQLDKPRSA
ncbi:GNAT family N-acetyltransferase [Roseateles amylovorans]|uniref:GNAT family N-acetyltransferase n=1 Tax=Roseateles amylovorans TaxID=2978473 RepID=A0ABY6B2F0_9BURK|nr:GNAT family protein [Roseateles amylovorans]UXH79573.1 GNAT family N-acetyltransferase [Roseateles amylovorans]